MMAQRPSFFNLFESPMDPSLVDDPDRLLDYINSCDKLPRLLSRMDDRGYSLIHYATERNQSESLKILLVNGANPNITSSSLTNSITPLHIAAANGHLDCLKRLVESGGDPLVRDSKNLFPRDHAQKNGQELCLEYLQKECAERVQHETIDLKEVLLFIYDTLEHSDIDSLINSDIFNRHFHIDANRPNSTPSETITSRYCNLLNNSTVVQYLSRLSRDIPVSLHCASVLHAACHYGNVALAQLLIDRYPALIPMTTSEGYTPLHISVAHGHHQVTRLLIEAYINIYRSRSSSSTGPPRPRAITVTPNAPSIMATTSSGHTSLHLAVALNDIESVTSLLKYQKILSLSLEGSSCGYSPLHLAVHLNHIDIVTFLLSNGANPNTFLTKEISNLVKSPLAEATINGNVAMVTLLVTHGAEDRCHDALGYALSQDLDRTRPEIIPMLFGSLIKVDESSTKHMAYHQLRKEGRGRHKMAMVEWNNIEMGLFKPEWISQSFKACSFFSSQNLEVQLRFKYINHLNLSGNSLTELPIEFFHLPNLTILNVSHNQLEALPPLSWKPTPSSGDSSWPCPMLTKLLASRNQIKQVPAYLFELPHLSTLDLSHNQLTFLPLSMWSAPKLNILNCSHNKIKDIPTNWPEVKETYQFVDITSPTSPIASMVGSPKSKSNTTRRVSIEPSITSSSSNTLRQSVDHRQSDDSSDTNEQITSEKANQTRLFDRLNVCNADLTIEWDSNETKDEIFDGLNNLNLSHNEIKSIPPNFPCLCPKLTRLDLSNNSISDLAIPRAVPANLKQLNVSHNEILVLDSYKSKVEPLPCTNPKVLGNSGGIIYRDPSKQYCSHRSHNHLISLTVLDASHNQISEVKLNSPLMHVSDGPCSRGSKIREADIPLLAALASASGKNQDNVRQLAKLAFPLLTRLVLHHNQINDVPPSVCDMTSLNSLDLSYNNIIDLSPELGKLGNLWEFPLDGLQLISPPHNIIDRGKTKDIIGFLWSLLQRARPYHRMKLMFVGKAGRGKTTLLKKISEKGQTGIQDNMFLTRMNAKARKFQKDLSTVGIVVSDWTYTKKLNTDQTQTGLRNITFMTWDFGGQEEYYATHQCFLSRRSLYIVVWNVLDGRGGVEELKPWLLNIQARAPNSPVIIVGTHYDKVKRSQVHEVRDNIHLIDQLYGSGSTLMQRQHGFPQIMHNMVVSCKSPLTSGINELRDKIFDIACQVKENTVSGRGIGCGRIPEYRLLMDQLVPASYLQLEDSVRNIALIMRLLGKPPVLTYKEFKEHIFGDTRTLVSRDVTDRELEQAVRFLHDNGTLLHYDDPLLKELYFVDPQWLSDMLAHIVTVREINPFVKDGIMKIKDFSLLFNNKDFPIKWQKEYLRLLTTFEVAVEFKRGKLLIPSHLPENKPNLPQCIPPENTVYLPPLRHTYLLAFVPSGFWPRLMSRVLSDRSIIRLAQMGCGLTNEECHLLKWTKWRTGMILRFGNVTLLSLEELSGQLFSGRGSKMSIMKDNGRWEPHPLDTTVYGINIEVPDVFPLLRYAELHPLQTRLSQREREETIGSDDMREKGSIVEGNMEDDMNQNENSTKSGDRRRWTISEKVGDFAKKIRTFTNGPPPDEPPETVNPASNMEGDQTSSRRTNSYLVMAGNESESDSEDEKHEKDETEVERMKEVLTKEDISTQFEELKKQRGTGGQIGAVWKNSINFKQNSSPKLTEENNDKMRAGLLSKVVDHVTLLVEDWFTGVRPRFLVVPCPHCSHSLPPSCSEEYPDGILPLKRSFSLNPDLRPPSQLSTLAYPYSAPSQSSIASNISSQAGSNQGGSRWNWRRNQRQAAPEEPPQPSLDTYYAFQYEECVVKARNYPIVKCPAHGELPLEYIAPDTLFLTEGRDVLLDPDEILRKEKLGQGAFATVYRAQIKRTLPNGQVHFEDVAIKAVGHKETDDVANGSIDDQDERGLEDGNQGEINVRPAPVQRSAIINGFNNLKKELSILSPLKHPNIVELYGVATKPLFGLVLELAPKGNLRSLIKEFAEAQNHIQPAAMQAVILQIGNALGYLHSLSVIYRDLKSDNVLVWTFPTPHAVLGATKSVGSDIVKVKLSDYGISQFVSTQGAKGLVGTPGFMAPEILKYFGKEAYNEKIDVFSFAMLIYEMITFRLPFEHLTPNQANQANENGARPTLKKKDLPCPVLIRELMVWCWQQNEDQRPTANDILNVSKTDQFLRLSDAIRVNNFGSQVAGSCYRIIKTTVVRPLMAPFTPSQYGSTKFINEGSTGLTDISTSKSKTHVPPGSGMSPEIAGTNNPALTIGSVATTGNADTLNSNGQSMATHDKAAPVSLATGRAPQGPDGAHPPDNDILSPASDISNSSSVHFKPLHHLDVPGGGGRKPINLPPLDFLPLEDEDDYGEEEEEEVRKLYEVWIASSSNHNSVATVVEYCGQFIKVEDIDLGDSPVMCIAMIKDKVWIGFEIGYLCIYDANSHAVLAQIWIQRGIPVQSIAHINDLSSVYVGLSNGTILSYNDTLSVTDDSSIITSLDPISVYQEMNEVCPVILPIPYKDDGGELIYHLWIGQKDREITILDPVDLSIIDFLSNPDDKTQCPCYTDQLPFQYLTCSAPVSHDNEEDEPHPLVKEDDIQIDVTGESVLVYGALKLGRYITVWNADTRGLIRTFDVLTILPQWREDYMPAVSSLYYHMYNLYVGLTTGEVAILNSSDLSLLTVLHCHRSHVHSFLPIDLRKLVTLQSSQAMTPGLSPSQPFLTSDSTSVKYKTGPLQLMSFGTGFRAYYESSDTIDYSQSSFVLVWEAGHWGITV